MSASVASVSSLAPQLSCTLLHSSFLLSTPALDCTLSSPHMSHSILTVTDTMCWPNIGHWTQIVLNISLIHTLSDHHCSDHHAWHHCTHCEETSPKSQHHTSHWTQSCRVVNCSKVGFNLNCEVVWKGQSFGRQDLIKEWYWLLTNCRISMFEIPSVLRTLI